MNLTEIKRIKAEKNKVEAVLIKQENIHHFQSLLNQNQDSVISFDRVIGPLYDLMNESSILREKLSTNTHLALLLQRLEREDTAFHRVKMVKLMLLMWQTLGIAVHSDLRQHIQSVINRDSSILVREMGKKFVERTRMSIEQRHSFDVLEGIREDLRQFVMSDTD